MIHQRNKMVSFQPVGRATPSPGLWTLGLQRRAAPGSRARSRLHRYVLGLSGLGRLLGCSAWTQA